MHTTVKNIVAYMVIAGVISVPVSAGASQLDSALDGMFSNLTGAGVAKTPDRTAFLGGGLALRTPIQNINIVTFDPPRISAGCGGLDMFGGSFSFVNAEQLVALFRKVAANAIGLAFKAAIAAINPQLSALMDTFQAMIADMNAGLKNSCMLATNLMKGTTGSKAVDDAVSGWMSTILPQADGKQEDAAAGQAKVTESPSAAAAEAEKLSPIAGNAVWKAINNPNTNGGLGALLTDPTSSTSLGSSAAKNANEIIMSLTGYFVVETLNKGSTASGAEMGSGITNKSDAVITIDELRKGGAMQKFTCSQPYQDDTNGGCLTVSTVDFNFVGMQGYVRDLLLGGATTSVDVVNALAAQPPTPLNTQQKLLLQSSQVPVMGLLTRVGFNQDAQRHVLSMVTPIIAESMLYQYMTAATKVLNLINRNNTAPIPEFVKIRIRDLNLATEKMAVEQIAWTQQLNAITTFTDHIRAGNQATFYTNAGR